MFLLTPTISHIDRRIGQASLHIKWARAPEQRAVAARIQMDSLAFKTALLEKDRDRLLSVDTAQWQALARSMCRERVSPDLATLLHSWWIEQGANIRTSIDDDALLVKVLRAWLPPYVGPRLQLYRGESAMRAEAGRIGICWTEQRSVAEMFGRGLQAGYAGGGRLLSCDVPAAAIIAAPNAHSAWLGESEFVVDPFLLRDIHVVARYPSVVA